jgi:hypothetical protein
MQDGEVHKTDRGQIQLPPASQAKPLGRTRMDDLEREDQKLAHLNLGTAGRDHGLDTRYEMRV